MIEFKYKTTIKGRNVRPNQFGNGLERAALAEVTRQAQQTANRIRCPKHDKTARITTGHHQSLNVEGCCDELVERVLKAIG